MQSRSGEHCDADALGHSNPMGNYPGPLNGRALGSTKRRPSSSARPGAGAPEEISHGCGLARPVPAGRQPGPWEATPRGGLPSATARSCHGSVDVQTPTRGGASIGAIKRVICVRKSLPPAPFQHHRAPAHRLRRPDTMTEPHRSG
ncbi:hypothetical protein GGTG_12053 [Gaeumannomyces tritici R3-111a-1]|uniref:Uncharacterized protein n=1 Tax=Gaeumannomyces tritici (strain R3-111a-1) TaxID=644352 RepID=J3PEX4_GAET3|nr:hypothetical protein GGTG_12053 [Gaeumannomyces tritici R3-111a-1]EJT71032.1 hypothetical protein GGTG_12053 [Gaeumannomyces tritici R3-111a-1]